MNHHMTKFILIALIANAAISAHLLAENETAPAPTATQNPATPASSSDLERAQRDDERAARREQERIKREQDTAKKDADLNAVWSSLSVEEKAQMVKLFQGVKELPKEEAKIINDGIAQFLKLPAEVREAIRGNYKTWTTMTPQQREAAREEYRQLKRQFDADWKSKHPGEEPPAFPFRIGKDGKVIPPKAN
jgi:hypothetical protein